MIQPEELRKGNWIHCKIYNGNKDVNIQFSLEEYKYIHLFEPIPLSSEIFQKSGFSIGMSNFAGYFYLDIPNSDNVLVMGGATTGFIFLSPPDGKGIIELARNVKYVHRLQNWYYLLSGGKELIINFE